MIRIRESKLPDTEKLGNAGSFFKNPVVSVAIAQKLKDTYPDAPVYDTNTSDKKLAAGWLIDKAGLKGFHKGDAGVHDKQALVLVNLGSATTSEIIELSQYIQATVKEKFGIEIQPEVNII